ncbi:hypothetical protein BR93DRAFT_963506 [Coniochaeta sp. PMI_546]|nr:hypothetical protein BR93DRAFT_963506 [Coniochaeta sp. PMI_546]
MARIPLIEGRDNAPCPKANGTTIGTDQQFVLLCGSDIVGDVLDRPDADDFGACVDLCASHHPKCDGVSFNKRKCELRANLNAGRTHPSKFTDAAVGQFPGASSNCATLGGSQVVQPNSMSFGTFCNFIINGKDMAQNFAPTFQDCMGQCAGTTGCSAVSYDPSMSQGFKNCYMKTGATASDNIADQGIDTAIVQNNAAVVAPAPAPAPAPVSSAAPAPAPTPATTTVVQPTTIVPDPVTISPAPVSAAPATTLTPLTQTPAPATTGGASFFTPPGAGSATTAAAPASVATETVISIITSVSVSDAVSVTQLITVPVTTEITATGTSGATGTSAAEGAATSSDGSTAAQLGPSSDASSSSSSRAWIAAPVVGSIAALVVVVVVFVMLGRRRGGGGGGRRPGTASSAESGESGGGLFTTWLPGSPRFLRDRIMGSSGVGSGSGSGMGNFSSVTGKTTVAQPAPGRTGSMRSSVFGILGTRGMGAERLEDVEEGSDRFSQAEKRVGAGAGAGGQRDSVTPVYEVRNGRMELRESLNGMNGLSQNRWSER